jgi:Anti-sigma regulatory factor (Ser/Thr protein kinase)
LTGLGGRIQRIWVAALTEIRSISLVLLETLMSITLIFTSDLKNSRLAGLCANEIASELFDEASLAEIELAVVEIVNNCIEHAYAGSDQHKIVVKFCLNEDRLSVEIIDRGKAIEPEQLEIFNGDVDLDFDFDCSDIEGLPEGDMGLKIVKNCMDVVTFKNANGYNHCLLIKYRQAKAQ